jgi:hypothetical protein
MLLNALMPATAHGGDRLTAAIAATDFCVVGDSTGEPLTGVDNAPTHRGLAHGNGACPFCLLGSGAPALPSRAPDFSIPASTAAESIRSSVDFAPASYRWPSAQPRAPPPRLS